MATLTFNKISPVEMTKRAKLDLRPGTTVRVWQKIQEKGKTRLQAFEGMIIARKHGNESGGTFTVRKVASGVGMERIYPIYAPMIDKIEILRTSKVRRSKLYFVREKAARELRRRMKHLGGAVTQEDEAELVEVVEKIAETGEEVPMTETVAEANTTE